MDDSAKQVTEWLQRLPPVYFYLFCGVVGLIVLGVSWGRSGDTTADQDQVPPPAFAIGIEPPPSPAVRPGGLPDLLTNLDPRGSVGLEMSQVIDELKTYTVRFLSGKNDSSPAWVGVDFQGTGVQQSDLVERFNDGKIQVQRIGRSEEGPRFEGEAQFAKFIANTTAELKDADQLRIEFRIYASEIEGETARIRFVVESYGVVNLPFAEVSRSGYRQRVSQATSLWETTWQRLDTATPSTKRYVLQQARVLAKELVAAQLNASQLLEDCTASVLRNCDRLETQLAFGLDEWSQYVAGVDIRGQQGLAVGDANGDGMDDLYVCQAHGLPNLLLIQEPDGTVKDQSVGSRTSILDQSQAALFLDLDNDGDQDLVVATRDHLVTLSNDGRGVFDLESKLSLGREAQSLAAADYDGDGDLDLFLCKWAAAGATGDLLVYPSRWSGEASLEVSGGGRNVLLRNDGGFQWADATETSGFNVDNQRFSRSAVWVDYDQDGDLDLYVANEFSPDQWFDNQDGWFRDVAAERGIVQPSRHTSVSVGDFNQDGRQDLFIATDVPLAGYRILDGLQLPTRGGGDPLRAMLLSENQIRYGAESGDSPPYFLKAPVFASEAATTTATADLNNDGLEDILIGNGVLTRDRQQDLVDAFYARAFRQVGSSSRETPFQLVSAEVTQVAEQVSELCREGYSLSGRQRNRAFLNIGEAGFSNASAVLGMDLPDDARALATTDWDQDGDLDIIATCRSGPQLRVFCNQLNVPRSSVSLELVGTRSNRDAIGARVELFLESRQQPLLRTVQAGSGALSQSSKRLVFGLGGAPDVSRLRVTWPTGEVQEFSGIEPGQCYRLTEGQPEAVLSSVSRKMIRIPALPPVKINEPPMQDGRTLLYPRLPMPAVQFQFAPDRWCQISPESGEPLLLIFWSGGRQSNEALKELNHQLRFLEDEGAQCVALLVEPEDGIEDQWRFARQTMASLEFAGAWGTLSAASGEQLELAFGQWFNRQQLPELPFAMLLGPDRKAVAIYNGTFPAREQLEADIRLSRKEDWQYRLGTRALEGFWIVDELIAAVDRLPQRLKARGHAAAAEQLEPARRQQEALQFAVRGEEWVAQAAFDEALEAYRQALALDDSRASFWAGRGQVLTLRAAAEAGNSEHQQQLWEQARADFRQALQIAPESESAALALAGLERQAGRQTEARQLLTSFLNGNRQSAPALTEIGRICLEQQRFDEATGYLSKAFDVRPNLPNLARDLGRCYLALGESAFARKFLRRAQQLQPREPETVRLLADAELATGEYRRAAELLEQLLGERPEDQPARSRLAWVLATSPDASQRNGVDAMELLSGQEQTEDSSPEGLEIRAACLAELGQFVEAARLQEMAGEWVRQRPGESRYSPEQIQGLQRRLEMYRQERPYRMAGWAEIPLAPSGNWR